MGKTVFDLTDDEWAAAAKAAGQDAALKALRRGRSVRGVDDPAASQPTLVDVVVANDTLEAPRPKKAASRLRVKRRQAA